MYITPYDGEHHPWAVPSKQRTSPNRVIKRGELNPVDKPPDLDTLPFLHLAAWRGEDLQLGQVTVDETVSSNNLVACR